MPIRYDTTPESVDLRQLTALLESVGWHDRAADGERLAQAVRGSRFLVTAWENDRMIGFCRAFSDGAFGAYVNDVVVKETHQGRAIGRELVRRLMAGRDQIAFVLHADSPVQPFYKALGFQPAGDMYRRPRKVTT